MRPPRGRRPCPAPSSTKPPLSIATGARIRLRPPPGRSAIRPRISLTVPPLSPSLEAWPAAARAPARPPTPRPDCRPEQAMTILLRRLARSPSLVAGAPSLAGLGLLTVALAHAAAPPRSPALPSVPADHAQKMARGQDLFRQKVRPVLTERCAKCH